MRFGRKKEKTRAGVSTAKLVLGAAGLLLFIVGVRRSLPKADEPAATPQEGYPSPPHVRAPHHARDEAQHTSHA